MAAGYSNGAAEMAAAPCKQPLEQQHIDVLLGIERSPESTWYNAVWHRPALAEVEAQCADEGTIRVFLNGCFDLMHVGHFNALRQAKKSFYQQGYKRVVLVAGVHSDAAIRGQKGPPLVDESDRNETVRAVKWVDELVTGLPYESMSVKLADALRVRFICHGDDMPVVKGGGGMYSDAIESGRFHLLKRTEGISTTNIIERLLRRSSEEDEDDVGTDMGSMLTTVDRLSQFAEASDPSRPKMALREAKKVVYVDGAFDLLHIGHVRFLQLAKELGDFLLVGLHSDNAIARARGAPAVLSVHERALALLSLGFVDDVILEAPRRITQDLITSMNISAVAAGKVRVTGAAYRDRYDLPRAKDIFVEIDSGVTTTHRTIAEKFMGQREVFKSRNNKLFKKECDYVEAKSYVAES
eukprot:TRINITY_DN28534_c0_g1_i1.p1 TRINITY_DN28534_c0_g1~~TRINITY_DN28534_c0_g1_i1.p1  ORF type:complete len:440 (+),score=95.53 TRINITY_DN28534_c0_g1_i1:88-1320(+)